MKITIKVLDVKDGDAIIIMLEKNRKKLIMLVDGGKPSYYKKVINELKPLLEYADKKAPDVVLCTHYDSDHIGGLIPVVKHYGNNIGEMWMFKSLPVKFTKAKKIGVHNDSLLGSFDDVVMKDNWSAMFSGDELSLYNTLITSIRQQKELENLVKFLKIKLLEPFAEKCKITGWPEIKIVAPVFSYYKQLFPNGFTQELIRNEITAIQALQSNTRASKKANDPFKILDKTSKEISNINIASVILLITIKKRKYLFTGDAGVSSFEHIKNYKEVLKNIYWLKIPHHASARNINSELIKLMKPKYAIISGKKYINKLVINCFQCVTKNIISTSVTKKTISVCHTIKP
jgi:beta-lactamase superfamily II metal-dependent hydrolase